MKPDLDSLTNKERGGYASVPVFRSGVRGGLGNFARRLRAAAECLGPIRARDWPMAGEAAGRCGPVASPIVFQSLSVMGLGIVAPDLSHGWPKGLDLPAFSGLRRLIDSLQPGRRSMAPRASCHRLGSAAPEGGFPLSVRAGHPVACRSRAAGNLENSARPRACALGCPAQVGKRARNVGFCHVGSGVRGEPSTLTLREESAGRRQKRAWVGLSVAGHIPLYQGKSPSVESGGR
jgi:hypothetical protein